MLQNVLGLTSYSSLVQRREQSAVNNSLEILLQTVTNEHDQADGSSRIVATEKKYETHKHDHISFGSLVTTL